MDPAVPVPPGAQAPGAVPIDIGADPARELAREELSGRIYQEAAPDPVQEFLRWIARRLEDLLRAASGISPGGGWGLLVLLLLLIVVIVVVRRRDPDVIILLHTDGTDRETEQKRTKQVVEVSNRFGEVGGSFKFAAARIERQRPATSSATQATDEQPAAAHVTAEPAAG